MAHLTRFLCFALCAFVVTCKSKHREQTLHAGNDNVVSITLSNRQDIQSYANFQTYATGFYYNSNYIEQQLYTFMQNLINNVQGDLFSKLSPQNFFPYYFITPKFSINGNGFHTIPINPKPNLFQTPTVSTSNKIPNKVEQFTTNRPQTSGTRQIQVETIPTLRSRTIVTQDTTNQPRKPETKVTSTTNVNIESPETTTSKIQEASTTQAQEGNKGPFFDDEDDTTRPIILRDTKLLKNERRLDRTFRKMPEVEHGSVQAGILAR